MNPISRHPVTITYRILFTGPQASQGPLPCITARMDFSPPDEAPVHVFAVQDPRNSPVNINRNDELEGSTLTSIT